MVKRRKTEDVNQKCVHLPLKFNTLFLLTVCWSVRDIPVIYVVIILSGHKLHLIDNDYISAVTPAFVPTC